MSGYKKYWLWIVFFIIITGSIVFLLIPRNNCPYHPANTAITYQSSEYDPVLGTMISQINVSEIYRSTYDLQNFSTRKYPSSGNEQAADYLYNRLAGIPGLETEYKGDAYRNIIASLPGKETESGMVFIVGAHYDSTSSDPEDAPGATDNACGDAIVLELARVMSMYSFNHTIQFAFWNAEEADLQGSKNFVTNAAENSLDIPLYFNYDSSCYDPDDRYTLDIMYDEETKPAADLLTHYNSVYGIHFNLTYNVHTCKSDHVSFRHCGYPAIMTHSVVHAPQAQTQNDTIDLVSPEYAGKNAQLGMLILSGIAELQPE